MTCYLFEILGTIKGKIERFEFLAKDAENAILFFETYIKDKKFRDFTLYKTGKVLRDKIEKTEKTVIKRQNEEIKIVTEQDLKEERERIKKALNEKNISEQLRILFGGQYVNRQNTEIYQQMVKTQQPNERTK